jgi:predicted dinucleotide-utilizing enzyme
MRSMGVRARIGVIGAGWWVTENHLPILEKREDVELVAICRRNRTELERVKERFGFKLATDDYGELLDAPLDGVMVTSPHHLHFEHARAALKKGLHVLVEKPLATRDPDPPRLELQVLHSRGEALGFGRRRGRSRAHRLPDGLST